MADFLSVKTLYSDDEENLNIIADENDEEEVVSSKSKKVCLFIYFTNVMCTA